MVQTLDGSEVSTLRWINERAVLRHLYEDDRAHSVAEIASACALSRPTVEGALVQLLQDGWVLETAPQASGKGAGRPAKRYTFADTVKVLLGVDLGPHGATCVAATLRGERLATVRTGECDLSDGMEALNAVVRVIQQVLSEVGRNEHDVLALTVGLPAIVEVDGRIALTVVVPRWQSFDLPRRIKERYSYAQVMFENDAKLATVAEHTWGAATGTRNMVNVLVGHRVAAGMIVDGRLARGIHGAAGEIGAFPAARWASAHRRWRSTGTSTPPHETLSDRGTEDKSGPNELQVFADDLAQGIAALCLVLDPEVVVIGGGIAQLGDRLIRPLSDSVAAITLFPVEMRVSDLGQSAVALGGIAHSRNHVAATVLEIDQR
ncbi:ROK family protein [Arthrobacter sp. RCC_34]|uniref:ROK family transcriptional regulator n=1 Tax=Arthrobacter sp. RCC_34 TaxID=3239230 RepID=UPI003523CC57